MRSRPALAALLLTLTGLAGCAAEATRHRDWSAYDGPGAEYFQRPEALVIPALPDPIEPVNRVTASFNHGLLVWVVRPLSIGWRAITNQDVRTGFDRAGHNLAYPVRLVSSLLQAEFSDAWDETARFGINTTVGLLGFRDPAWSRWHIAPADEDVGKAFGEWGWQADAYLTLPALGPSSDRDAVGKAFDILLDPATWIGLAPFFSFNAWSDDVEDYVRFSQVENDPYDWMRYIWSTVRREQVADYRYRADPDDASVETLQAIFLTHDDPDLLLDIATRSVHLPSTGRDFTYTLSMQDHPAPLVIVLPGLGAHRLSEPSLHILERLRKRDVSVVTISSVFNYEFMQLASTAELPGVASVDAHDTHVAIDAIVRQLEAEFPGRITERLLMGLSMGGLHTLIIGAHESAAAADLVDFDLYLAINPPVDLTHGMAVLDDLFNAPLAWPESERRLRIETSLDKVVQLTESANLRPGTPLPFGPLEAEYLIGLQFRFTLRDVIFVSQLRHNLGVLLTPLDSMRREPAYREIWQYSWMEYYYGFLLPAVFGPGATDADDRALRERNNLEHFRAGLLANDRLRVVTNEDDFLLGEGDLEVLRSLLGDEHLIVFPTGGHMGNLYRPDVSLAIRRGLADILPEELEP